MSNEKVRSAKAKLTGVLFEFVDAGGHASVAADAIEELVIALRDSAPKEWDDMTADERSAANHQYIGEKLSEMHALVPEIYWCGCVRLSTWARCPDHGDLDADEQPRREKERRARASEGGSEGDTSTEKITIECERWASEFKRHAGDGDPRNSPYLDRHLNGAQALTAAANQLRTLSAQLEEAREDASTWQQTAEQAWEGRDTLAEKLLQAQRGLRDIAMATSASPAIQNTAERLLARLDTKATRW